jgi:hypothetical protein
MAMTSKGVKATLEPCVEETLFQTRQYEMRWSADDLKTDGKVDKTRDGWIWL